ncbi:hypothetical protein IT575_07300 [bacterium]|nr:hypothetical protein [bacterium]
MSVLRRLSRLKSVSVSIPRDESGYLGRECPVEACLGIFKVLPGTGIEGVDLCYCPYCGHSSTNDHFWTPGQLEYAKSVAMRKVRAALDADLGDWARSFGTRSSGGLIKLSAEYRPGTRPRLRRYAEPELETHVECEFCSLKYAVFGIMAFCPDCGAHNSLQLLNKNYETVEHALRLAETVAEELKVALIVNALEDCVSILDGFGRELTRVHIEKRTGTKCEEGIHFQSLEGASKNLEERLGIDLKAALSPDEWETCRKSMEKRHVFAHRFGVADEAYLRKTGQQSRRGNKKVTVDTEEVRQTLDLLRRIATFLYAEICKAP